MKTVTLKLTNCQDCPHHKNVQSPYTGDSFDMVDEDTICTLAQERIVTASNRPWEVRRNSTIPDWCPLTKKRGSVAQRNSTTLVK